MLVAQEQQVQTPEQPSFYGQAMDEFMRKPSEGEIPNLQSKRQLFALKTRLTHHVTKQPYSLSNTKQGEVAQSQVHHSVLDCQTTRNKCRAVRPVEGRKG